MRKLLTEDGAEWDRTHWEAVVRTIIERLGVERLHEIIDYVQEQHAQDERAFDKLKAAIETEARRAP